MVGNLFRRRFVEILVMPLEIPFAFKVLQANFAEMRRPRFRRQIGQLRRDDGGGRGNRRRSCCRCCCRVFAALLRRRCGGGRRCDDGSGGRGGCGGRADGRWGGGGSIGWNGDWLGEELSIGGDSDAVIEFDDGVSGDASI